MCAGTAVGESQHRKGQEKTLFLHSCWSLSEVLNPILLNFNFVCSPVRQLHGIQKKRLDLGTNLSFAALYFFSVC